MNSPQKLRHLFVAGLACAAAFGIASCGSGSDGGGAAPSPAPTPAPSPGGVPPLGAAVDISSGQQVGANNWADGGSSGQPAGGLNCGADNQTFHVHSHVAIIRDGTQLALPGHVGIVGSPASPTCVYPVHTHDRSGKVHIEAAAAATFTLGQLFAVWGQPLAADNVGGITGMPLVVYITDNGTTTQFTGNPADIELSVSKRLVTLQLGTPISEIPNYTWSGN